MPVLCCSRQRSCQLWGRRPRLRRTPWSGILALHLVPVALTAQTCDLHEYQPQPGLTATSTPAGLKLEWTGASNQQLRAEFLIRNGQPVIHELAARSASGTVQ